MHEMNSGLFGVSRLIGMLCATLYTTFFAILLFCALPARAAQPPAAFEAANQAYSQGDFKAARDGYETLVKEGNRSANLFYNLGNAEYRLGEKGRAILAYERALALDPSHPEAKANLERLRGETSARVAEPAFWEKALLWPEKASHGRAAWMAAAAFWVLCFSLLPVFGKRRPAWVLAALALTIVAWAGGAAAWEATRGAAWIVTGSDVRARTAPADSSKAAGTLPQGSLVRLLMERGEWLYAVLPDGSRGWIARGAAEPVAPAANPLASSPGQG